jgi:uncharacterized protein (DUF1501 family)
LYDAGQLAIVHATGSPDHTRSHFDAQDYMESATPGVKSTADGWLNRYMQARRIEDATPFRGVAIAAQMPRTLQGLAPALAMNQLGQFGIRGGGEVPDMAARAFEAQYAAAADRVLHATGRDAFQAMRMLKAADPQQYQPANGANYPGSPFGQSMRQIAQLIKSNVGIEVAFAESTNWDHHVNEGSTEGQIANRLNDFGAGIAAFVADLGDRLEDVLVLTMSEFGRAVAENGNGGTDHGHGNAMFVIGGGVRGGKVYGTWPGLAVEQRFERRDLAVTTDFRDVFGEVVVRHLGLADPAPVFKGYRVSEAAFKRFL